MSLWEDVVKKSSNKSRVHLNLGVVYQNQKRFKEAIGEYYIALGLNPNYKEAYNNFGNIYKNIGWIDKAIEHYQIALNLEPYNAYTH